MKITYEKFITKLASLKHEWVLNKKKQITSKTNSESCPYIEVSSKPGYKKRNNYLFDLKSIFNAADNTKGHNKKIRKDLLKACKLNNVK